MTPRRLLTALASAAAFVLAWKAVTVVTGVPAYILPAPEVVADRGLRAIATGTLWTHTAATLLESSLGFVVGATVAIGVGLVLARSVLLERALSPYIVAAQAVPILALAPLLDIWFGGGLLARVVICASSSSSRSRSRPWSGCARWIRARRALRVGGRRRALPRPSPRHPWALPVIFGGLRVGVTLAVIGAVVAEWAGASVVLGILINIADQGLFDTPLMFVALVTLAVIGLAGYGLVVAAERRLVPNQR